MQDVYLMQRDIMKNLNSQYLVMLKTGYFSGKESAHRDLEMCRVLVFNTNGLWDGLGSMF